MHAHTYPGKGLTLPQLIFALNEELNRTAYSPSYVLNSHPPTEDDLHADLLVHSITFDVVSQLDRDTSTALTTIRGWRSSFAHINRIPMDVLSLIALYLTSQKDRIRVTFVCRYWRRIFLQYGALWSQLFLGKGTVYAKALLERAKGTALDVIASAPSTDTLTLLFPHAQQIEHLEFLETRWKNIIEFSGDSSRPFPLLRTLKVAPKERFRAVGAPLSAPLFSSAINLKEFVFDSNMARHLNHFIFQNLTTFELTSSPAEGFDASTLLDFLKASPMLQTVQMRINADIIPENIPRKLVILPHVDAFSLILGDSTGLHDIVTNISCPNATHTSLHSEMDDDCMTSEHEIFPTSVSWNPIIQQYTRNPMDEVALEVSVRPDCDPIVACSLNFRCSGKSVVTLCWDVFDAGLGRSSPNGIGCEVFRQALRTICDHPLVSNIRFLDISSIGMVTDLNDDYLESIGNEFGRLFVSLGSLDTFSIGGYDPRLYLASFLDLPESHRIQRCTGYPPIKELKISHPTILHHRQECREAVVELAKSQHARGMPFERVTINMEGLSAAMVEKLKSWVGVVNGE